MNVVLFIIKIFNIVFNLTKLKNKCYFTILKNGILGFFIFCFFNILLILIPISNAANPFLKVDGITGKLEKNIRIYLSSVINDEAIIESDYFRMRVDKAIRLGLKSLGYYEPTIRFFYQELAPPYRPILTVKVDPGKPVYVQSIKITLNGEAKNDKDYLEILSRNVPEKGTILSHSDYENLKQSFIQLAIRKGYFDAKLEKSYLGVSLFHQSSHWVFDFNSGNRYRFGSVKYEGSQICEDYLNNILPFKKGEYYSAEQLAEFNQRLLSTGWFNSAIVTPVFDKKRERGVHILPMEVVLTPRAQNHLELGIGYSTDIGLRLKSTWNKPWVNSEGQSLTSNFSFSQLEKIIDASFKIPLKKSPLEQYYVLQAGFKCTNLNDIKGDMIILNLLRNWDHYKNWQYAINFRWILSHFSQENTSKRIMLLYPGISISRIRQKGGAMPHWGDSQRYTIDISNRILNSDINFIIFQAQNIWIRTAYKRHRFIIKSHLGLIKSNHFNTVPPYLRFFAGGDRSIRSYSYQRISPSNYQGKLIGSSKLAVGSLEYQYNMRDNWWGAVFFDAGEAVNYFNKNDFKFGAGFGVRWVLPFGPIKLDVAAPFGDPDHSKLQFYLGLGIEL